MQKEFPDTHEWREPVRFGRSAFFHADCFEFRYAILVEGGCPGAEFTAGIPPEVIGGYVPEVD